jgi:tripartite-type tricarboxylate transporter receptor subunit TctC
VPDFIEFHRAGKLRIVGVLGNDRQPLLPDVPTFHEMGLLGFEDVPYYGIFGPKGLPTAFITEFDDAMAKVLQVPLVHERMQAMGLAPEFMTAQKLGERERAYTQAWAKIIKEKGFGPQ